MGCKMSFGVFRLNHLFGKIIIKFKAVPVPYLYNFQIPQRNLNLLVNGDQRIPAA